MEMRLNDHLKNYLQNCRVLPLVQLTTPTEVERIGAMLATYQIKAVEIVLRHPAAIELLALMKKLYPSLVVSAGTVKTAAQAEAAIKAGADFLVSPGFSAPVAAIATNSAIPYLPGAVTPSEIMTLEALGYHYLKFFPAESMGGINTLQAYAGVFPSIKFLATGGINATNYPSYLAQKNVIGLSGSWLVPSADLAAQQWDAIAARLQSIASINAAAA